MNNSVSSYIGIEMDSVPIEVEEDLEPIGVKGNSEPIGVKETSEPIEAENDWEAIEVKRNSESIGVEANSEPIEVETYFESTETEKNSASVEAEKNMESIRVEWASNYADVKNNSRPMEAENDTKSIREKNNLGLSTVEKNSGSNEVGYLESIKVGKNPEYGQEEMDSKPMVVKNNPAPIRVEMDSGSIEPEMSSELGHTHLGNPLTGCFASDKWDPTVMHTNYCAGVYRKRKSLDDDQPLSCCTFPRKKMRLANKEKYWRNLNNYCRLLEMLVVIRDKHGDQFPNPIKVSNPLEDTDDQEEKDETKNEHQSFVIYYLILCIKFFCTFLYESGLIHAPAYIRAIYAVILLYSVMSICGLCFYLNEVMETTYQFHGDFAPTDSLYAGILSTLTCILALHVTFLRFKRTLFIVAVLCFLSITYQFICALSDKKAMDMKQQCRDYVNFARDPTRDNYYISRLEKNLMCCAEDGTDTFSDYVMWPPLPPSSRIFGDLVNGTYRCGLKNSDLKTPATYIHEIECNARLESFFKRKQNMGFLVQLCRFVCTSLALLGMVNFLFLIVWMKTDTVAQTHFNPDDRTLGELVVGMVESNPGFNDIFDNDCFPIVTWDVRTRFTKCKDLDSIMMSIIDLVTEQTWYLYDQNEGHWQIGTDEDLFDHENYIYEYM